MPISPAGQERELNKARSDVGLVVCNACHYARAIAEYVGKRGTFTKTCGHCRAGRQLRIQQNEALRRAFVESYRAEANK